MSRFQKSVSIILTIGVLFLGAFAQSSTQNGGNEREVSNALQVLETNLDNFHSDLNYDINRGNISDNEEKQINGYLKSLANDVDTFQDNLSNHRDSADDVTKMLNAAKTINDNISNLRMSANTLNDWRAVRSQLDTLALNYNLNWSWKEGIWQSPNQNSNANTNSSGLTGTYQLDTSRSENVKDIANQALANSSTQNPDQAKQDLEDKLESPQQLTIDLQGNQAVIASTLAQQITFQTDGSDRTQTLSDGSTLRTRATLRGEELTISNLGGNNDYTVTFTPIDNGQSLKVTRRVTTDYLSQTVFAESVYTKTDAVAKFDIYSNSNNPSANTTGNNPTNYPPANTNGSNPPKTTGINPPAVSQGRTGQFVVPNGTIITGLLDNYITTKVSQNNDRFKIKVQGPSQFRGAVIEGYITGINRSGKITGRSSLTLNFDTIHLQNGETYDFAGELQSITDPQGKTVKVDTEGKAKGDDQSKTTAIRSGVGAGLGALIGVIAGGGKGAAIGAIIGGGAGAGSVVATGKEDLELKEGTSITIQASSPIKSN